MTSPGPSPTGPQWRRLYEVAATQDGYFTTAQAAAVGYSRQLLAKHLAARRVTRVMRGIHRLASMTISSWSGHGPPG